MAVSVTRLMGVSNSTLVIDCICGKKIPAEELRKHVRENHEMDAYKAFITNHFKNPDPKIPDSWECTKCRHLKNKETILISEETGIEHIKDEHFDEAIKEFADSVK